MGLGLIIGAGFLVLIIAILSVFGGITGRDSAITNKEKKRIDELEKRVDELENKKK